MKEQDIRKLLAGKLREFRLRAKMTTKEVGERIGKSAKTISGWEHGRGQPDADMLFRLCELYEITNIGDFYAASGSDEHGVLSSDEKELLQLYRSLNKETRFVLLTTARGFAGNPDMQKRRIEHRNGITYIGFE